MKKLISLMLLVVILSTSVGGFAVSLEDIEIYKKQDILYKEEGYSLFNEGLTTVMTDDGWNYMNENYEVVDLNKGRFSVVFPFSEGLAAVMDQEFKLGFIDKQGDIVIPCQYGAYYAQGAIIAPYFKDGVADVLDKDYHLITTYNYSGEDYDDMNIVYEKQDMMIIRIDKSGNVISKNLESRMNMDGLNTVLDGGIIRVPISKNDKKDSNASDWAKSDIEDAKKLELLTPSTSKNFKADISRLEFAELIVRLSEKLLGKEMEVPSENVFTDTKNVDILKAYEAGIINGTGPNTFDPESLVTREQIATMLYNTIKYLEQENNTEYLVKDSNIDNYRDSGKVSQWAKIGVGVLANNEIMMGTSDTELSPKNNTTIEQSIILINRLYNRIND